MQEKQHVKNQQSYILLYSAYYIQVEVSSDAQTWQQYSVQDHLANSQR